MISYGYARNIICKDEARGLSYLNFTEGDNFRVFHHIGTFYKKNNKV